LDNGADVHCLTAENERPIDLIGHDSKENFLIISLLLDYMKKKEKNESHNATFSGNDHSDKQSQIIKAKERSKSSDSKAIPSIDDQPSQPVNVFENLFSKLSAILSDIGDGDEAIDKIKLLVFADIYIMKSKQFIKILTCALCSACMCYTSEEAEARFNINTLKNKAPVLEYFLKKNKRNDAECLSAIKEFVKSSNNKDLFEAISSTLISMKILSNEMWPS